ncbi:MAG: Bile acid 7-alpha dehydratase BaiE [Caulobacter sp.]|nr:Bile acid 7-alpha dehydratase BaiE [Caulobacter sp.]
MDGAMLDKLAVAELVQTERAARDQGQWERLAACYHPDSLVSISWIETSGPEFVEASKTAFAAGVRHLHQMAPSIVSVNGDRALAESGCAILLPGKVGYVAVTVTSQARLHVRAERRPDSLGGRWGIVSLRPVYFIDSISAQVPGEVPVFDAARLAGYRQSYRFLSYVLVESGKTPRPDLAGADRPDLTEAMLAAEAAWLAGR